MSRLYRVWAKYEPDFVNPMTARRGQWRVTKSHAELPFLAGQGVVRQGSEIGVTSCKPYNRGSIIRPHAELRRVLAARKVEQ